MHHQAITALKRTLSPHLALSNSRLETLALIVMGMIGSRTVNLTHIASGWPAGVRVASTYRRLQRFFQYVDMGPDWAAPLIIRLLGLTGSWHLCLDRTTWKVGARDINYLVLAVVTRRFRVPLLWTVLDAGGNSATDERVALLRRYLAVCEVSTIRLLLADREFIGAEWMKFLNDNSIPFAIRLKGTMRVTTEEGHTLSLNARLRQSRRTRTFRAGLGVGDPAHLLWLTFAAKRLKGGELLIVASNASPRIALEAYRKRWAIECLFGDAKTRGLNLEDTRLTDPRKLSLLMALVALALAWAGRSAATLLGAKTPKRKAHGYLAKSWFRIGFDNIRTLLNSDPVQAVLPWRRILQMPSQSLRVV